MRRVASRQLSRPSSQIEAVPNWPNEFMARVGKERAENLSTSTALFSNHVCTWNMFSEEVGNELGWRIVALRGIARDSLSPKKTGV